MGWELWKVLRRAHRGSGRPCWGPVLSPEEKDTPVHLALLLPSHPVPVPIHAEADPSFLRAGCPLLALTPSLGSGSPHPAQFGKEETSSLQSAPHQGPLPCTAHFTLDQATVDRGGAQGSRTSQHVQMSIGVPCPGGARQPPP